MVLNIAIVVVALSIIPSAHRMLIGPTRADRVSAAYALLCALVALIDSLGMQQVSGFTSGLVLVGRVMGVLGAVSLSRELMGGVRLCQCLSSSPISSRS